MNAVEIEEAVSDLVLQPFDRAEFPFQFLEAFGNKETTLKRLRSGTSNRSDVEGAILQRTNIHILTTAPGETEAGLKALQASPKTAQQKAKFILATDGVDIQAIDLTSDMPLTCAFTDLPTHFGFLLPLAGITTISEIKNNPIDIKATGRLDKLYVALLQDERNKDWAQEKNRERFNHFMAQLIFCFFAEDTGIFDGDNLFTATVEKMSHGDPALTQEIITNIFAAMNLDPRKSERKDVRPYANVFPYVNGGLFGGPDDGSSVHVPAFNKMARTYLIRAGELDWTAINPDIFGSMIQAVADDEERGELGMHYTSVPNILKVLNPLFLDSLNEDLDKAGKNKQQLGKLKKRIARIRVFDPACGSGNFLVIAYKRMREIEYKANQAAGWETDKSVIPLTNYRGIELKSFAAEIARLALIIAEYQCDELYMGQREALALFLPLEKTNWITCENALRVDWLKICPPTGETKVSIELTENDLFSTPKRQSEIDFENEGGETYICGNPPYLGSKLQTNEQKNDLKSIFETSTKKWKSLDYVAGWFLKASEYSLSQNGSTAFVSTNSICQGQQVPILWPLIFSFNVEIVFAYPSFKWKNVASNNAVVTVSIIGISQTPSSSRNIYSTDKNGAISKKSTNYINAYLASGENVIIDGTSDILGPQSKMMFGNMPRDAGNLLLSIEEKNRIENDNVNVAKYLKLFCGSEDFISGKRRGCIWVDENDFPDANKIPQLGKRFQAVKDARLKMKAPSTQAYSNRPYRFVQIQGVAESHSIIIPRHSSEDREYLPVGLLSSGTIIADSALAIYDAPIWNLALIASKLHLVWIATVCGKIKTDYRYSNTLGWNTFPVPRLTTLNKSELTRSAENILISREVHYPSTISELYKKDMIPPNLLDAHKENDRIIEEIFIGRRFKNDSERIEYLLQAYVSQRSQLPEEL